MKNLEVLNVKRKNILENIQSKVMCYKALKNGQKLLYYADSNKLFHISCCDPENRSIEAPSIVDEVINFITILDDLIVIATDHFVVVLDINEKLLARVQYTERIRVITVLESKSLAAVVLENLNLQFIDLNESDIESGGLSKIINIAELKVTLEATGWGSSDKQFQGKKTFSSKNRKNAESKSLEDLHPADDNSVQNKNKPGDVLNASLENDKEKVSIAWHEDGSQVIINYFEAGLRVIKTIDRDSLSAINEGRNLRIFPQIAYNSITDTILVLSVDANESVFQLMLLEDNGEIKSHMDPNLYDLNKLQKLYFDNYLNMLLIKYSDAENNSLINLYLTCGSNYYLSHCIKNSLIKRWEFTTYENTSNLFNFIIFDENSKIEYTMKLEYIRSPVSFTDIVIKHSKADLYIFLKDLPSFEFPSLSVEMPQPVRKAIFHPKLPIFALIDQSNNLKLVQQTRYGLESGYRQFEVKTVADFTFNLENNCFLTAAWTDEKSLTIYSYGKGSLSSTINNNSDYKILFETISDDSLANNRVDTNVYDQLQILNEDQFESYSESFWRETDLIHTKLLLTNELFVNDKLVSKNVSSYMVYKNYLFFTTTTQELTYVRLSEVESVEKHVKRPIEAGTLLVGVEGKFGRIVALMPRGNLESITNMYYIFDYIRELASKGDFISAAEIIRIERLDANVLVEINPPAFLKAKNNYLDFIKKSNSFINCIIDLGFDDILCKTYSQYVNFPVTPISKRQVLTDILSVLENLDVSYLSLRALLYFKLSKTCESFKCISKALSLGAEKIAAQCVKALLTVSSAEKLRRFAYATYDPNIVKFVYQATNADPVRDHIDVDSMNVLRKVDPYRFRYDCCIKSQNFELALNYLIRSSTATAEEIIDLAQKHNLLSQAYELAKHIKFHAEVGAVYARRLAQKGDHKNAARVYCSEEMYDEAIREYANDGNCTMVNSLIRRTTFKDSDERRTKLFQSCIKALISQNKPLEAALVADNYLGDSDQAIEILSMHNLFGPAKQLSMAYDDKYKPLIENRIRFLKRHYWTRIHAITADLRSAFIRLIEIRAAKMRILFAPPAGEDNDAGDDDNASTIYASSYASTQRTRSTSSNSQRKENLKKIALKKGGYYEDIALIRHIYKDVELLNDCIKTAVTIFQDPDLELEKYVSALQAKTQIVFDWFKSVIPIIWPVSDVKDDERLKQAYEVAVMHFQDLDEQYRTPPSLAEDFTKSTEDKLN